MFKSYYTLKKQSSLLILKYYFIITILLFTLSSAIAQSTSTLSPLSDAYIRNGSYSPTNFGSDTGLVVKGSTASGYTRLSYLKFSLNGISNISSAKLRVYGRNTDNISAIAISAYGVDNDTWTESGITYNNAPAATSGALSSANVNNQSQYYEFDVSSYVVTQATGDQMVTFLIKDPTNQNANISFNSKENANNPPQLIISTSNPTTSSPSNALLFVENLDKFPANDHFAASRIQIPWTRDSIYAANHDSLRVRVHNNGMSSLTVSNLILSNSSGWKIERIKGLPYMQGSSLPLTISSGTYADIIVRFIAIDQATRIKVLHDTLTIVSNDDKFPSKTVFLSGLWQKQGEGSNEPSAQDVVNTYGLKTNTGFGQTDPDKGDTLKLKGSEIRPSYFVKADTSRPVSIIQIAAYHGCCNTSPEKVIWFDKGSPTTSHTVFTHVLVDGQTVLPRKAKPSTPADGTFTPTGSFGFRIGSKNTTDAKINPGGKIGVKVWKALDAKGNIIPDSYIIGNDYLGSAYTNYDFQDNVYFVKNLRPEKGSSFYSGLDAFPSALDFSEKVLQTTNSLQLNLSSLGKTYADGSADPVITISSIAIVGENKSEFSASMPVSASLNPQSSTTLTVNFNPTTQGLKIADLLIYYNNSQSPLRVPVYGIAKASSTTVTTNYRINSGSSASITINGKTWSADNQYSFDNLEPFSNSNLKKIACTDEDALYLKEQSSNADKKPFRYEFPVANGDYVVRLHFAEIYWGAPGGGLSGGAGSRVMNVSIENQLRLANFDVTQEVGGATAIVKNFPVTVTDGKLNIDFSSNVNRPMVCAVEVISFRSTAARPAVNYVSGFENKIEKVIAYPNPVQKRLMIKFPDKFTGKTNLQIVDAIGRVYDIGRVEILPGGATKQIDISNLSLQHGLYYLKVSSSNDSQLIKLIVE